MKLCELLRFKRTSAGVVPAVVIARLRLPAPPDVVEQLFVDFGVADHIQAQFGQLDFHRVAWELRSFAVDDLARARLYRCSRDFEELVEDRRREARDGGIDAIAQRYRDPKVVTTWREKKTWARNPLAHVLGDDDVLHWIEGQNRLGYLLGLVDRGDIDAKSQHTVWCMSQTHELAVGAEAWREVLRSEHMPFTDWLVLAQGDDSPRGRYGSALVAAEFHDRRSFSEDLDGAISIVGDSPDLRQLHEEWLRFVRAEGPAA